MPLALTDDQLAAIMNIAQALQPRDRGAFLEDLARELHRKPIGAAAFIAFAAWCSEIF